MRRIWVVMVKEVIDNLRDRRSLLAALIYPLLGPALMIGLMLVAGRTLGDRADEALELPIVGAVHAPDLVAFARNVGATVIDEQRTPAELQDAVRAGDIEVGLIVPEGYRESMAAGRPATVQLVFDASRSEAAVNIQRAQRLIEAYSYQMGAQRLLLRGINPALVSAVAMERIDVSTPQSQAGRLLNLLPYFLIFATFIGGMYLAIDATAGERERGSLEPLLMNPVARYELVAGKLLATMVFTLVSVIETVLAFAILLGVVPLEEALGVRISLSPQALVVVLLITLPMILFAVPLQFIIATFTRSFKEAQNYLSFLPLVPALPGAILAFIPMDPTPTMMLIPTFGQQLLIAQVLRGQMVEPWLVALGAAVTVAFGAALMLVAVRLYERERILFGG